MKTAMRRKHKKLNKAYDTFKNEISVVFKKQFAIDDDGNTYLQEIPLAIGHRVASSNTEPLWTPDQIQNQSKGVAVEIIHYFLDELWNIGNQQINISDECPKILIKRADGSVPTVKTCLPQNNAVTKNEASTKTNGDKTHEEEKKFIAKEEQNSDAGDLEEEKDFREPKISPEKMDDLIKRNFAMCVVRHLKDTQLPLEPSLLQGEYMYKYEHKDDGRIDFKQSSYCKVTKFLKKMKQLKLLSFTKPKGGDHEIITEFNRKSRLLILNK